MLKDALDLVIRMVVLALLVNVFAVSMVAIFEPGIFGSWLEEIDAARFGVYECGDTEDLCYDGI
jgi:hypothetical protein